MSLASRVVPPFGLHSGLRQSGSRFAARLDAGLKPPLYLKSKDRIFGTAGGCPLAVKAYRTRRRIVIGMEPSGRAATFQESSSPLIS